jgi:hypothetical protein
LKFWLHVIVSFSSETVEEKKGGKNKVWGQEGERRRQKKREKDKKKSSRENV